MSKNIAQLAQNFSKIVIGQATVTPGTNKLVSPIRGKQTATPLVNPSDVGFNVSRQDIVNKEDMPTSNSSNILIPYTLQKSLSELVDTLRQHQGEEGITEIKSVWQDLMADGTKTAAGILVAPTMEPMLEALHHAFLFLKDIAKAPANDVSKAVDVYQKFSTLGHPTKASNSVEPYNYNVLQAQMILNKPTEEGGFSYNPKLKEDGVIGKNTRAAFKWFRDHNGLNTNDMATAEAIMGITPKAEVAMPTLPAPDAAPSTWGNKPASQLARRFSNIIGNE